ncbi:MAG: transporter substrate-binding domain-containing protein [Corynebacterium sp.]|uniref:transporter substrate-binding domain-containing protein n=1 Tax=Corynebacterium sp. TaxID=1720 RepID=UPI0026DC19A8|nr:transporter substrate-binding domain-containing protein [Corynebacterium sp.]MDO4760643.1 transporter substrate-binding domain-containing protein [Corynebacterium sp.]
MRHPLTIITAALLLTSCASHTAPHDTPPTPTVYQPLPHGATIEKPGDKPATEPSTAPLLGSLRPDSRSPAERVPHIVERGRLIVGVDQSQNLLSFRDPTSGHLHGFEVDIAREIARDIFGDPNKIEFRYIDSSNWVLALEKNHIDVAMRTISITRNRQDQVFFSTPYFTGNTRMLVDKSSHILTLDDVDGHPICVTDTSTGAAHARARAPHSDLVVVKSSADCLITLQQNQAKAVITDDTILSGMAAQDPSTIIVGESLNKEHYGIAIAKPGRRHPTEGLIRQVNATLERIFTDGTWQHSFDAWLGDYLPYQSPPTLNYRKETAQ